jgi:hypothetical protein
MSKQKSSINEILELNSGLFLNPNTFQMIESVKDRDLESIFSIIEKPSNWKELSSREKVIYISRGNNGSYLRERLLNE